MDDAHGDGVHVRKPHGVVQLKLRLKSRFDVISLNVAAVRFRGVEQVRGVNAA